MDELLLPSLSGVHVERVESRPDGLTLHLKTISPQAACPVCGQPSDTIHSRYQRTLADCPVAGRPARVFLNVRRFRCPNLACPRRLFAERIPDFAPPYARATSRLQATQTHLAEELGGEPGSRLAHRLGMPASGDTLLRRLARNRPPDPPTPRLLGVDDFALRKGHNYGTILVDLERRRVVDLLPGRDGVALKAWLRDHSGIELVTRDRWPAFEEAVREEVPGARQVADRWHLLKNLREAVERLLQRRYARVRELLMPAAPVPTCPDVRPPAEEPEPALSPRQEARRARRRERVERFEQVRRLHREGMSIRRIARALGVAFRTILRYLREEQCPDWQAGRARPTRLDRHAEFIDRRLDEGCRNAAVLHRELAERGCRVGYDAVRRFVGRRLARTGRPGLRKEPVAPSAPPVPSARQLSFEFIRRPEDRREEETSRLGSLREGDDQIREGLDLAGEFAEMVRRREGASLTSWLERALGSGCPEMREFARGLHGDEAVAAALTEPWSNGQVEGQVNRLKAIKRQMFGRAGLGLLRRRVVGHS